MLRTNTLIAGLAALALAAGAARAQTGDTLRLDLRGPAPAATTLTPGLDGDADTDLVRGWRGRYYGGYGYGSFYRPYYSSFYYRPSVSFYYSRPFGYGYGGYGYGGFGYSSFSYYRPSYYSSFYYAPPVYYSPYYYCPIGDSTPAMPYATSAQTNYTVLRSNTDSLPQPIPYPRREVPYAGAPVPNATYPYDGGPRNPVPLPGNAQPTTPRPTVPLEGKAVSLPRAEPKYTYPAYGEGRTAFAEDRTVPVSTPTPRSPSAPR